jgi:predicted lipoprotein with Yx(FWY)xxD motif
MAVRPPPARLRRFALPVAMALALAPMASACGDDTADGPSSDNATTTSVALSDDGVPEPAPSSSPEDGSGSATSVNGEGGQADVGTSDSDLGTILVDGRGRTLYLFTPDGTGDPTCVDQCAQAWPPLVSDGAPGTSGEAQEALVSTVERPDGTQQVTYGDHPLYTYAADAAPGDVTGQGVGGNWFVVGPDGSPVKASSGTSSGY